MWTLLFESMAIEVSHPTSPVLSMVDMLHPDAFEKFPIGMLKTTPKKNGIHQVVLFRVPALFIILISPVLKISVRRGKK